MIKDKFGNTLEIGDYVIYTAYSKGSLELRKILSFTASGMIRGLDVDPRYQDAKPGNITSYNVIKYPAELAKKYLFTKQVLQ